MSAPAPKWTFYDDLVEAELQHWPGVTWTRQVRSKHYALVLTFGGVSRFVTYPCSPSDRRGAWNHVATVKATLREMGAVRTAPKRSGRVAKAKPPRQAAQPVSITRAEPLRRDPSRDPWAALQALRVEQAADDLKPAAPTLWARVASWFRGKPK